MQTSNCVACGKPYIIIAGHSCGDSPNTQMVRETLAKEIEVRKKLEKELEDLRHSKEKL